MSMTLEEAIKNREECLRYLEDIGAKATPSCVAAVRWSVKGLNSLRPITRKQVAEVWKGCDLCLDDSWQRILMIPKRFDHTNMLSAELAQFCPGCGRPLTDKAVDMAMERLEALYDKDM